MTKQAKEIPYDKQHTAALAENRRYNKQKAEEAQRRRASGVEDFMAGRDTPEAREVREVLAKVAEAKRGFRKPDATGKPVKLSKVERRRQEKQHKKRYVTFHTPDGQKTIVDLKTNPLVGIYRSGGISAPQFAAAASFQRDFDNSQYSGMRSPGFDPGVDGGKGVTVNLDAVASQRTLAKLKLSIGEENYSLLEAVIGFRATFREIHERGGEEAKVLSTKLRQALNKTATFYAFQSEEPEGRTLLALRDLLRDLAKKAGVYTS